jgi:hypothetical protein
MTLVTQIKKVIPERAAVQAARSATFSPTYLDGRPVKVSGVITYNFVP